MLLRAHSPPEFQHIGDKYADLIQEAIDYHQLEFDDVTFITAEDDPFIARVRETVALPLRPLTRQRPPPAAAPRRAARAVALRLVYRGAAEPALQV